MEVYIEMTSSKTKDMVMTALMAAIIFVATYLIRIPNPATGGYSHLGDCMIFLAVVLLGRKNGSAAAAIGGAFSVYRKNYYKSLIAKSYTKPKAPLCYEARFRSPL